MSLTMDQPLISSTFDFHMAKSASGSLPLVNAAHTIVRKRSESVGNPLDRSPELLTGWKQLLF